MQKAVEIRHRVEPELLHQTMITLHNITNCLAVFLSFAEQHASMRATSSFTYVQDASTHLVKMAQSDLSNAFSDIDKLSDTWELVSWDKNLVPV